ncbi:hypothetical protein ACGK9R_17030 [Halomonas sp. HNIBRBA4712]|uniref:hypothetical protein n=1 Tax=Halomonas sp. HNIBRBA4712 TaxID=3373087 RepID=UPI003744D26D
MELNSRISKHKFLFILLGALMASAPLNIYLAFNWTAAFVFLLFFIPMLGIKAKFLRNILAAIFFGYYISAMIAMLLAILYY